MEDTEAPRETTATFLVDTPSETAYRQQAHEIAASFQPNEFRPAFSNQHVQTISGLYLRPDKEFCYIPEDANPLMYVLARVGRVITALQNHGEETDGGFWDHRQRIDTKDGDFFHVDYKYHCSSRYLAEPTSQGLVVIVHGLQASSNSSSCIDMANAYINQGFDVACINFRGCSGVPNNRLPAYHLGFTQDLLCFLELLNSKQGGGSATVKSPPPIFLSGFSLGANVVLKCLGELGVRAHAEYNIHGAAVACAPFDNERNINFVQAPGFNELVYNRFLLKSLKETSLKQLDRLVDTQEASKIDRAQVEAAKSISDIENAVIAPLFGFSDNIDYYRKTQCLQFVDGICVPTFVLNAGDDPFFDPEVCPWEKSTDQNPLSTVKISRPAHGGHLGFLFHRVGSSSTSSDKRIDQTVSFFPSELARFLKHSYDRRRGLDREGYSLTSSKRAALSEVE